MNIINRCWTKVRSACKACKRGIISASETLSFHRCRNGTTGSDHEINNNPNVQHIDEHDGEPPDEQVTMPQSSQQRRRPDIPIIKRRSVDPEKVAAVVRACRELRVPVGEDLMEIDKDDEDVCRTVDLQNQNG